MNPGLCLLYNKTSADQSVCSFWKTTTSEQRAAITKYQGLAVAQAAQFLQNMDDDQNMYVSCRSLMRFRSLDEYWNWNMQSCTLSDGIS